ncbi:MAG: hypothetical protein HYU69_06555, partial [Bacteroidetes bacterium]|nr:hypothetical protein [Bacteroidota bacterium]
MKKRHTLLLLATAVFLSLQLFSQTTYQKLIGGAVDERNTYCFEAADGNILIAGHTTSGGAGGEDIFVMKTDTMMNIIWSRTYGGPGDDYLVDRLPIAQNTSPYYPTPDGGFFLIGFTNSFGQGSNDFYLLRIDKDGNLLWSKTYGTPAIERGVTINRYPNGNLVLGGDVEEGPFGGKDVFLIITDSLGNMIKNQQVGKGGHDQLFFAQPTIDFGYIYAGATSSEGSGGFDAHLVRFDINANPVWSKIYGGPANDSYNGVIEIYGSAFLAVGYTQSFGAGSHDFLLSMFTDNGDLLWSKTYGGTNSDIADHVIQTSDGGYAIVGTTQSFGGGGADIMVVKTDANGDLQWTKTYGGAGEDISRSIDEIQPGGYHICGATSSFLTNPDPGMGGYESYAIRTDANGNTGCNEFSVTPSVSSPTLTTNYYFPDTTNTAGLEAYAPTQTDTIIFYQRVLCENIPQPTAINYTWNGSGSGGWNSPTNWTPTGIPTDIDNVTIVTAPNAPYISSNPVIVHKLIMNNDAGLTVSQILTVTDTLELISGIISNTSPLNLNNNSVVIGG